MTPEELANELLLSDPDSIEYAGLSSDVLLRLATQQDEPFVATNALSELAGRPGPEALQAVVAILDAEPWAHTSGQLRSRRWAISTPPRSRRRRRVEVSGDLGARARSHGGRGREERARGPGPARCSGSAAQGGELAIENGLHRRGAAGWTATCIEGGPRRRSMLLLLLLIILVLALAGGGFGHRRYGYAGWSPALLIIIVLAVLLLSDRL